MKILFSYKRHWLYFAIRFRDFIGQTKPYIGLDLSSLKPA